VDDIGVDLVNTAPFAFQCHSGQRFDMGKYDKICASKSILEPMGLQIPVYIFKRLRKPALIVMPWNDFKLMARDVLP